MDQDEEITKFKQILIAGLTFAISTVFSYRELKYTLWSKTADAMVTRKFDTAESTGRRRKELIAVEYQFTETDGTTRMDRDRVAIDFPLPQTPTVTVQYLPAVKDSSRLLGISRSYFVWAFIGSFAWLITAGVNLWREAHKAVHGPRKRGRSK